MPCKPKVQEGRGGSRGWRVDVGKMESIGPTTSLLIPVTVIDYNPYLLSGN